MKDIASPDASKHSPVGGVSVVVAAAADFPSNLCVSKNETTSDSFQRVIQLNQLNACSLHTSNSSN